ncbi:hypothetical protein HDU97_005726 [Phlyctochytrium planicorne]|nr:hypothetical protein HDU97_005726 [Phlyctochytrium planicorne]
MNTSTPTFYYERYNRPTNTADHDRLWPALFISTLAWFDLVVMSIVALGQNLWGYWNRTRAVKRERKGWKEWKQKKKTFKRAERLALARKGPTHLTLYQSIQTIPRQIQQSVWLSTVLSMTLLQDLIDNTRSRAYFDQLHAAMRSINNTGYQLILRGARNVVLYRRSKPGMARRDSGKCLEERFNGRRFLHYRSESEETLACIDQYVNAIKHGDVPRFARSPAKWRFLLHQFETRALHKEDMPQPQPLRLENAKVLLEPVKTSRNFGKEKRELYFPVTDRKVFGRGLKSWLGCRGVHQ